jgi:formylmethanofuran dehydrogenase subunit E
MKYSIEKSDYSESATPWCRNSDGDIYSFEQYVEMIISFHGFAAPGLVIGGKMLDIALNQLPKKILFDAMSETSYCLPDAIQLLTPCTIGNGWLKIVNMGRYALSLYDKYNGNGIRVFVDTAKLDNFREIKAWFLKLKPKQEQDSFLLLEQIRQSGSDLLSFQEIKIAPDFLKNRHKGQIGICTVCGEAFPSDHGRICRACQGESPYILFAEHSKGSPALLSVPVEQATGHKVLHDMTQILPGKSKGSAFKHGQTITAGDICRLQQMGRQNIYIQDNNHIGNDWVHENDAAVSFAKAMTGQGIIFQDQPDEGKIDLKASCDGLLIVDEQCLEMFNMIQGVMCAARQNYTMVKKGRDVAGTRAIPLYLPRTDFEKAMKILKAAPLFQVTPLKKANIGILVTGTEVFQGLIKDNFIPIIRAKAEKLGCKIIKSFIVPDDRNAICNGVKALIKAGADILITTGGLSVDPDDVTRQAISDAGAEDILYGAPILPGAMTLLARIGKIKIIGVPACALYFKTTSFDLLMPRLLAGTEITRQDLARMGHGGFCLQCKSCKFPRCAFGK